MENKTDKPYSLQDCKDTIAQKNGHRDFEVAEYRNTRAEMDKMANEAAELYASKATEELRKENARLDKEANHWMNQCLIKSAEIERLKESNKQLEESSNKLADIVVSQNQSNKELVEVLKHSLNMMEQTLSYRENNGLTAGNIFLSSTIKKAKEIIQKSEGDVNKKI